ncbi:hypothetical protein [Aurantiacibacter suaedae]|uniref:hypothetical protein n=1 Tax=Aurantiacibacter suaedae TaxID=2545755 RepID=UPI0010F5F870|nr:hypothetical protein [Aurantiacibacter suaedae]
MTNLSRSLIIGSSVLALAACGPESIGSPGSNGDINIGDIITNPTPAPTPTPTPTGSVAAADCPTLQGTGDALLDSGTISGPEGEWRVCTLPSIFTASTTLPYQAGTLYRMSGRVDVGRDDGPTADASDGVTGTNVNLTIEPGVILFGEDDFPGASYMIVNRGSKIFADGTAARPIIWTGEDDITGNTNDTTSGLWGGLVLLGRAPVADCSVGSINQTDQTDCEMRVEGIANNIPFFGGNTPTDSSGSVTYNQIRYSGFTLDLGGELQSLTLGGIGSGTKLDYIQSYNSSDDGTEFFGGRVNMKHLVVVGAEDDSIDTDSGVQANLQYVVVVQRDNVGDRVLESDSPPDDKGTGTTIPDALPRSKTTISNFSFWATGTNDAAESRGASDITLANGVIYKPASASGVCLDDNDNVGGGRGSEQILYSVLLDCTSNSDTDEAIAAGSGNTKGTNTLTGKYINGASEQNYTPVYDVSSLSSFFDTGLTYIGAVPTPAAGAAPWTRGWTCDSTTVSFGSGLSCQALPVYN